MTQLDIFKKEFSEDSFENKSRENGFTHWYASDLMDMLSYTSWSSFMRPLNKAIQVCNSLGIPIMDNFIQVINDLNGKKNDDYKLSRFACYLIVMNSDIKKPVVANAQAYFAGLAGAIHDYIEETQKIERVIIRDEISEHEKSLSGIVKKSGVLNYAFFQNAGYRGMYNMNMSSLKQYRGLNKDQSLLDFMGGTELAANLFRITQTSEKIKNENITGQDMLEKVHENIGKKIRNTMKEISGTLPEQLPKEENIKNVKKGLKTTNKTFQAIDKKKKSNKK